MLQDILESEEYLLIPSPIRTQLESSINKLTQRQIYVDTLYKTYNEEKESVLQQLKDEKDKNKVLDAAIHTERANVSIVEKQLTLFQNEECRLKDVVAKHEQKMIDFTSKYDHLFDENVLLKLKMEKLNNNFELLNDDYNSLTNKFQSVLQEKIKATLQLDAIKSKENELKLRESDLESEKQYYTEQIDVFKKQYHACNSKLINFERQKIDEIAELHQKVAENGIKINLLSQSERNYKDAVVKLSSRTDELNDLLSKSYEEIQNIHNNYTEQLLTQTKLADAYKEKCQDLSVKIEDLEMSNIGLNGRLSELTTLRENEIEEYGVKLESFETSLKQEVVDLKEKLRLAEDRIEELSKENTCNVLQSFSPMVAESYKMFKSGLPVTQLSQEYNRVCDQLTVTLREKEQLAAELEELSRAVEYELPAIQRKNQEQERFSITVRKMEDAYDEIEKLYHSLKERYAESDKRSSFLSRENERMKSSMKDLTKQVQCLLKEVEFARGGYAHITTSPVASNSLTSDEMISDRLVIFRNIQELQMRNQELLITVRELSASFDAEHEVNGNDEKILQDKIHDLEKSLLEETANSEYCNRVITMLKHKVNLFKNLSRQLLENNFNGLPMNVLSALKNGNLSMDGMENDLNFSDMGTQTDLDITDIDELMVELKSVKKTLSDTTAQYEQFKQKQLQRETEISASLVTSEKFNEMYRDYNVLFAKVQKFDQLRQSSNIANDISECIKLTSDKICQSDACKLKQYETVVSSLRQESLKSHEKIQMLETKLSFMVNECTKLRESETLIKAEKVALLQDLQSRENLLANLQTIKMNIDRSNAEWKSQFENKFDFTFKECCILQRRLEEEQDAYQNKIDYLSNTVSKTETRLEEVQKENAEFKQIIDELKNVMRQNNESLEVLNNQSESDSVKVDHSILEFEIAYLKKELLNKNKEIAAVNKQLVNVNNDFESAINLSGNVQKQLELEHQNELEYKKGTDEKLSELVRELADMKEQNAKLNENISELSILKEDEQKKLTKELEEVKMEHSKTIEKLSNLQEQLLSYEAKIREDSLSLLKTQKKYSSEMLSHTDDLKKLEEQSNRIAELERRMIILNADKNAALEKVTSSDAKWIEQHESMKQELEQQTERLNSMIAENDALLKQIVELISQLNALQTTKNKIDLNESSSPVSLQDKEGGGKNYVQLVLHLSNEKNLLLSKLETLNTDNARMTLELETAKQKLENLGVSLEIERNKSEQNSAAIANSATIMRKVHTLDIMSDSNELLRNERNSLKNELTALKTLLENMKREELHPLIDTNRVLTQRLNNATAESDNLRTECTRWRNRVQELTDKLETYNLDEIMKSLTSEKEKCDRTLEELRFVEQMKIHAEEQVNKLTERISILESEQDDIRKQLDREKSDCETLKVELNDSKKTHEAQELVTKEMKTSNMQLRMIAKKYKTQYTELMKVTGMEIKNPGDSASPLHSSASVGSSNGSGTVSTDEQERLRQRIRQQVETELAERFKKLSEQAVLYSNEIDTLKKEKQAISDLMTEHQTRSAELLKRAHLRIMTLTNSLKESRGKVNRYKADLDTQKQQAEISESKIRAEFGAHLLSPLERRISELDREKIELQTERDRNAKDIENLTQRVATLQRQLTSYQSTRPSVSVVQEKGTSESPPTANIKPMAGSSSSGTKLQTSQQLVTVLPWKSTTSNETPCASIRPRSVQARSATSLRTSQSSPHTSPRIVSVVVSPRQQLILTSTGASNIADVFSSIPSSSSSPHVEYNIPSTNSTMNVVRHVTVTPRQISQSAESTQMVTPLGSQLQTPPTVAFVAPRIEPQNQSVQTQTQIAENIEQQQQQQQQSIVASSQPAEQSIVASSQSAEQSIVASSQSAEPSIVASSHSAEQSIVASSQSAGQSIVASSQSAEQSIVASSQSAEQSIVASSQSAEQFSSGNDLIQEAAVHDESSYHVDDDDSNQEQVVVTSEGGETVGNVDSQPEEQQSSLSEVVTVGSWIPSVISDETSTSSSSVIPPTALLSSSSSIGDTENQQQPVTESVRSVSSSSGSSNNNNNTVTTTQANLKRKRQSVDTEMTFNNTDSSNNGDQHLNKRVCVDEMFSLFDDDGLNENAGTSELRINEQDVEYEVSTSSQGEQEFENALMVDSEIDDEIENGQAMPDEGIVVGIPNQNPDVSDNVDGSLEGSDKDDQDATGSTFNSVVGSDVDEYNNPQDQNNEAEIRNDSVVNESSQLEQVEEAGQSTDVQETEDSAPSTSISQTTVVLQQNVPSPQETAEISIDDSLEEQFDMEIEVFGINPEDQSESLNDTLDDSIVEENTTDE